MTQTKATTNQATRLQGFGNGQVAVRIVFQFWQRVVDVFVCLTSPFHYSSNLWIGLYRKPKPRPGSNGSGCLQITLAGPIVLLDSARPLPGAVSASCQPRQRFITRLSAVSTDSSQTFVFSDLKIAGQQNSSTRNPYRKNTHEKK